ncbi:MAG: electron transfer flavoprotein subunit alpha/FixB family protein [Thermoleophilia bacterium]
MASAGEVWVFIQLDSGRPAEVSLELLGRARELADELNSQVGALLLGSDLSSIAQQLPAYGADRVYQAKHPALQDYRTLPYARIISGLIREHRPEIVLYGATTTGRDLAPRVASMLRTGLTADCTDLRIGDHRTKERNYDQLLYQIRPAFGGNIIATIISPDHRPQMATVREGVFRLPSPDATRTGHVLDVPVQLDDIDLVVEVIGRDLAAKKSVDLKAAHVIVSGGIGVGSKEGFALIKELADTLGGVVGATRAAVDAGWIDHDHQVGQTGTTVRPKLYIAAGISGSVQHRAGMEESARILAINTDPLAPIFSVAHYGIVADLFDVIPRIIRAYRSKV